MMFSIIMPNFNGEFFLKDAIQSVLNQTLTDWELIIIDDGSSDSSEKIVESIIEKDDRIKLLKNEKNLGAGLSRNRGIEIAKGRYIAFLDSDDKWVSSKLEAQLEFIQAKRAKVAFSSFKIINAKSEEVAMFLAPKEVTYKGLLKTNSIGNLTGVYDSDYFGKVYFRKEKHEDYILWLTLLKKIERGYGQESFLAYYRKHSDGISHNKFKAMSWQWRIYRSIEKLTLIESLYYSYFYIYNGLTKYKRIK